MPPSSAGSPPLTVKADVAQFKRLFDKSSQVDKKLKTALRRNIRQAAGVAAAEVKAAAMQPGGTVSAHPHHTGLRAKVAAGVSVKVMTGNRAGVTIVASARAMSEKEKSLVRAWEAEKGWRHPTFRKASRSARAALRLSRGGHGASHQWVTQKGNPYFRKTITDRRDDVRLAVEKAMAEAAESLKGI